ncbi:MAG: class I SAM-dependent methyltransferase [Bacteroidetes bacterium]|nr:class I SAM-dependent methyltransferase [Bacteroidota bacterium]
MNSNASKKQYDDISGLYDILSAGDDGFLNFRHIVEEQLNKLPAGARILDCSCGTGNHAIWMARQGFEVYASDISEGMLRQAKTKAKAAKASITFIRSSWEELPQHTDKKFEFICSPGNSFSHVSGLDMLDHSLQSIRKVLKKDGSLYFDLRNWEKTFEENSLLPQDFQIKSEGVKYDVSYAWNIKGWNTSCEMLVNIRKHGETTYTQYVFDFFPLSYSQLHDSLKKGGFRTISRDFFPDNDYYYVIAK